MGRKTVQVLCILVLILVLSACGEDEEPVELENIQVISEESSQQEEADHGHAEEREDGHMMENNGTVQNDEEMHAEDEEHEHAAGGNMAAMHNVPAEAAAVENPVVATEDSIAAGADLFAQNCASCHGEEGEGDGPAATGLDPKPADLQAEHVQMNSDGALFYIISHGVEGTAMVTWEAQLGEEERWHLVNFLRTFAQE